MRKYDDIAEKAFDEMLAEAAIIANEREGSALKNPEDEIEFSREHMQKMNKIFKMEKRDIFLRKISVYTKRIACVLLVCAVVSGISIASVDAWRVRVWDFVLDKGAPNTQFNLGEKSRVYSSDGVTFNYIPKGFELTEKEVEELTAYFVFDSDDKNFVFHYSPIDTNSSVDTEDGTVEEVAVNEEAAIYVNTPRVNSLIWADDDLAYKIHGNISKREMIKIAENLIIKK